jgi:hypothetical protein
MVPAAGGLNGWKGKETGMTPSGQGDSMEARLSGQSLGLCLNEL